MKVDFATVVAIIDSQAEVYRMQMTRAVRRGNMGIAQMSLGGIEAADRLRGRLSGKWFDELQQENQPKTSEKNPAQPKGRLYRRRRKKGGPDEPNRVDRNSRE